MNNQIFLTDFKSALISLKNAISTKPTTDLEKAGCIQYFEFCFELAWKSIKSIAENSGVLGITSPKSSLKHAFSSGWINDEEIWLEMLLARNRMSHTYSSSNALTVFDSLHNFLQPLQELSDKLNEMLKN
jgi:nucleotidyltransferase substrate binding protein (TIGR01987 family)